MTVPSIAAYEMPAPSDLPRQLVDWVIDPDRAVLLVHDMQEYFLRFFPAGKSPVVELVDHCARLVNQCRSVGIPVAFTAQPGDMSPAERGLLRDFWGTGMTSMDADRAMVAPLTPRDSETVFTKWRYSAFFRSNLREFLEERGRDQLVICGVYAHVGCMVTAIDAFTHDIQPFLVADAVADFTADYHLMALRYVAERSACVLPTESVLHSLATPVKSAS
ncbi:isochorismatase family protein [Amycolatopsis sp. cmx-11-12]|uniref:isochorismatase family protein n=1 Tax=Amycolatopsis sp. cmx-11-12 TaxID=2785795 RepID=UPI003917C262